MTRPVWRRGEPRCQRVLESLPGCGGVLAEVDGLGGKYEDERAR